MYGALQAGDHDEVPCRREATNGRRGSRSKGSRYQMQELHPGLAPPRPGHVRPPAGWPPDIEMVPPRSTRSARRSKRHRAPDDDIEDSVDSTRDEQGSVRRARRRARPCLSMACKCQLLAAFAGAAIAWDTVAGHPFEQAADSMNFTSSIHLPDMATLWAASPAPTPPPPAPRRTCSS